MNRTILALAVTAALSACAGSNQNTMLVDQELSESFVAENIKVVSRGCNRVGEGRRCTVVAIESLATAPSYGGSATNRRNAMDTACAAAMSNAMTFMGQEGATTRTVERSAEGTTQTQGSQSWSGVEGDDSTSSNQRLIEETTVTTVTTTIRQSARRFMVGWAPVKQEVVGPQEVSCTMGWSLKNENIIQQISR